ncbi:MAG: M23 family metallopeptidase [Candidatus Aenigmarchaeota archaeon]|nr:M23 family metallopeptidase [Candidatus Aenigmarchaeota archaeon]
MSSGPSYTRREVVKILVAGSIGDGITLLGVRPSYADIKAIGNPSAYSSPAACVPGQPVIIEGGGYENHLGIDPGGVDFKVRERPPYTPVMAAGNGIVVYRGDDPPSYKTRFGSIKSVTVGHGLGHLTDYQHLNSWNVFLGQNVSPTTQLGEGGNTGTRKGDYVLHFGCIVPTWFRGGRYQKWTDKGYPNKRYNVVRTVNPFLLFVRDDKGNIVIYDGSNPNVDFENVAKETEERVNELELGTDPSFKKGEDFDSESVYTPRVVRAVEWAHAYLSGKKGKIDLDPKKRDLKNFLEQKTFRAEPRYFPPFKNPCRPDLYRQEGRREFLEEAGRFLEQLFGFSERSDGLLVPERSIVVTGIEEGKYINLYRAA